MHILISSAIACFVVLFLFWLWPPSYISLSIYKPFENPYKDVQAEGL